MLLLLSMITNKANAPIDNSASETTVICVEDEFRLLLFPIYVRASKNEAIVTAKATAPFRSILLTLLGCLPGILSTRRLSQTTGGF